MSYHLEVPSPSGPQLIELAGQRVSVGKLPSCGVSLGHDPTVSRMHALLENYGSAWSIRDLGSRNGTYVNAERLTAERLLRPGDQLRFGNSRSILGQSAPGEQATEDLTTKPNQGAQLRSHLTPRELDVLIALCRPVISQDPFAQPASIHQMARELYVTQAAIKQHLHNLYNKFAIPTGAVRRVALANAAIRHGTISPAMLGHRQTQDYEMRGRPA
jgi:pSer/pThr/pTyr-binding forkhead associated (FHA) protein